MTPAKVKPMRDGDFFLSHSGNLNRFSWRNRHFGRLTDWAFDMRLRNNPAHRRLTNAIATDPPCRVLIATVRVPGREQDLRTRAARPGTEPA